MNAGNDDYNNNDAIIDAVINNDAIIDDGDVSDNESDSSDKKKVSSVKKSNMQQGQGSKKGSDRGKQVRGRG